MKKVFICLLASALATGNAKAQDEIAPINTGTANFLTFPADARGAGMGGTGVALSEGSHAVFCNGATAVLTPRSGGMAYTLSPVMRGYESGHSLHTLAGFYKLNRRHVLLGGFRYYHYPQVAMGTDGEIARSIRPKEWALHLGYAYEPIPYLGISVTAGMVHSDMGLQSTNALAFDLGIAYQREFRLLHAAHWTAGLQVCNLGTKFHYPNSKESLPTCVKAGGSIDVAITPAHRLTATADLGYRTLPYDTRSLSVGAGVEYTLAEHAKLRGGYHYGDKNKGDTSYATAGAGFRYAGVQVDFSWLFAEKEAPLRNSFWTSLSFDW